MNNNFKALNEAIDKKAKSYLLKEANNWYDKRKEKLLAGQHEFLLRNGFNEDEKTYVIILNNTYDIKNQIKADGGKFSSELGWHLPYPSEKYPTVEISKDEVFDVLDSGLLSYKSMSEIKQLIKDKSPEMEEPQSTSEYVGNVGDRLILDLTVTHMSSFESHYGYTPTTIDVVTMEDNNHNIFTWFASNLPENIDVGTNFRLKGTVKDHKEYRGQKQTVLTRCQVWGIMNSKKEGDLDF